MHAADSPRNGSVRTGAVEAAVVLAGPEARARAEAAQREGWERLFEGSGVVLLVRRAQHADPMVGTVHELGSGATTVVLGPAWLRGEPFAEPAASVARLLSSQGPAAVRDRLFGTAKYAHLEPDGSGCLGNDPWSAATWYRATRPGLDVVGSDARAVAEVAGIRRRDPFGAGWPIAFGFACGTATGWEGVHAIAYGAEIRIDEGRVHEEIVDERPWRAPGVPLDDLLDAALAEMRANVAAVAATPERDRLLFATGGRDNRLVVALLREAGLASSTTFVTRGKATDKDVIVARTVAAAVEAEHRLAPKPMIDLDERAFRDEVLAHVARTSGASSPWDAKGEPLEIGRLTITGLWGEPMRSYYARHRFDTLDEVVAFLTGTARLDPAGLLRPEAREAYASELADWARRMASLGEPAADLTDAFYMPHRLRRWLGVRMERNPELRAHPLMSVAGCRAAYTGGFPLRRRDGVHFALLLKIAPDLLAIPLAGARFYEANAEAHGLHPASIPAPVEDAGPEETENWQDARFDRLKRHLVDDVYADRGNPVFDLVDRPALARLLRREFPASRTVRQRLVATLGAGLWLGGQPPPSS